MENKLSGLYIAKCYLITGVLLIAFFINSNAQSADSTISKQKNKYYQFGQRIQSRKLNSVLENNSSSALELNKYKINSSLGIASCVVGSATVLAGAVVFLASNIQRSNSGRTSSINNTYYTGFGMIVGGLVLDLVGAFAINSAKKHLEKSISNYNSRFKRTGMNPVKFNFSTNENGVGILMKF
jgi:hypothetical protein